MDGTTRFRIPDSVTARRVADETVLLDMASESYIGLNPVAACAFGVWQEGGTVDAAVAAVEAEFDAPLDQIHSDVLELAGSLMGHGLLEIDGSSHS